ncbi:MAG: YceI family protein [Chloroflexi bacterium]|nr:YceI family protein [Chloroflexota bacterium]
MTGKPLLLLLIASAALLLAACASTSPPTPAPTPIPTPELAQGEPSQPASTAQLRTFVIDPAASEVRYEVDEEFFSEAVSRLGKKLGFFRAVGRTNAIEGQLVVLDDSPPQVKSGEFSVDISTLKSDDSRRDRKIREDFLESARYPIATFRITSVEGLPQQYVEGEKVRFQMTGDMTIREITIPVTWNVEAAYKEGALTGEAQTLIYMKNFGFMPPEIPGFMTVTDGVTLVVRFKAVEQSP